MGWRAVWQLALQQFGAEAVEIRIVILVAAAFLAVMILIGLRYAFRPAGPQTDAPVPENPKRAFAAAPPVPASAKPAPQSFRLHATTQRPARKSAKRTINRQQALRPQIRRAGLTTSVESDAPTSPLPPRG